MFSKHSFRTYYVPEMKLFGSFKPGRQTQWILALGEDDPATSCESNGLTHLLIPLCIIQNPEKAIGRIEQNNVCNALSTMLVRVSTWWMPCWGWFLEQSWKGLQGHYPNRTEWLTHSQSLGILAPLQTKYTHQAPGQLLQTHWTWHRLLRSLNLQIFIKKKGNDDKWLAREVLQRRRMRQHEGEWGVLATVELGETDDTEVNHGWADDTEGNHPTLPRKALTQKMWLPVTLAQGHRFNRSREGRWTALKEHVQLTSREIKAAFQGKVIPAQET